MKKLLLFTVYCLLFTIYCKSQINLVPNPSFEDLSQCPTFVSQLEYATYWFQPTDGTQFNPDLYSSCCTNSSCGYFNSKGYQIPKTGNSYVGAVYYVDFFTSRELLEVKLLDSLNNSKSYCIKFYVSLAENSGYATSNFWVYLSEDSCLSENAIPPYTAQIQNPYSNIIMDTNNWVPIELEYIAQGKENFVTIGGFEVDSLANILFVGGTMTAAYYYIDDVSVIDISTPAYAGVDTTITIGDSIFIGRTPEIGLNDDCVWYINGSPIDTIAGLWVQPDSTTTYILEQTICGYTTYDTVTVTVLPTSIESYDKQEQFVIYPNPSNGELWIKLENGLFDQCKVVIYDIAGKVVFDKNILIDNNTKITPDLHRGTYFISIQPNNNNIKPFNGKVMFIE
ncbi:MAG: hypothetical protein A3K10_08695 [Bacteroidetes bacterium RIFCSPLOWO2_12_FULL_31_6]|nr:MAG: hypothetical protein A3K10_08695 [Bacteroidetes bacterium RIFCSPLOWO2_12_FULL_31_6]